jgi:hypothetical protein
MNISVRNRVHLKMVVVLSIIVCLARPISAAPTRQIGIIDPSVTPRPPDAPPIMPAVLTTDPRTNASLTQEPGSTVLATLRPVAYLPLISSNPNPCPTVSSATYSTIGIYNNAPYKDNRLTDQNADFRLSILGYAQVSQPLTFVSYGGGGAFAEGPRLGDMFQPHRVPAFMKAYQVYQWNWDESLPPPYGSRGALAHDWPVTVLDLATVPGEAISVPGRDTNIAPTGNYKSMVLYAGPNELTVAYMSQDQVVVNGAGYVVNLLNLCVNPNLVATYRAQLSADGRRSTMRLPALLNDQPVGTAMGVTVTLTVRDAGMYMDPRSKQDWWYDFP